MAGRLCDILDALLSAHILRPSLPSAKRPMSFTEGGNSDYSDEDLEGNSSDSSVEVLGSGFSRHPRPIAGSKRIIGASTSTAAAFSTTASSSQQPAPMDFDFQPSQFTDFSLPITSAQLGSLPLHENTFPYHPSVGYPGQNYNEDIAGIFEANLQEPNYTNRTMAEPLSTAFAHLGI